MGTKKAIRAISLLVFCLLIFSAPVAPDIPYDLEPRIVLIKEYDKDFFKVMFGDLFTEPFEQLVIFFKKGKGLPLGITTREPHKVDVDPSELKYLLAKRDRKIKDITFMVHNHLTPARPSPGNHRMHHALRRLGFKGPSFVYYPHSGELLPIE